MANIVINDPKFKNPIKYSMDDRVYKNIIDKILPALHKKDEDYLIAIDGAEGAGKSTLAFQIGKAVDHTLDLSRIVFNATDFRNAIFKAKKGQVIIYDEAFTGLSSRSSLSGINRALVSLMMQMRQKNLCIILVLPTFFLLDKYAALFRTKALFHVYKNKGIRGYFRVYNRKLKKLLYLLGKKDYSYKVKTKFRGRFYGVFALGDAEYEQKYRDQKSKALEETEKDPMTTGQIKYRHQRDIAIFLLRRSLGYTYDELSNLLGDYDLEMTFSQIRKICSNFGESSKKNIKETIFILEKQLDKLKPKKDEKEVHASEKETNSEKVE